MEYPGAFALNSTEIVKSFQMCGEWEIIFCHFPMLFNFIFQRDCVVDSRA
jgi:hypothetical protein